MDKSDEEEIVSSMGFGDGLIWMTTHAYLRPLLLRFLMCKIVIVIYMSRDVMRIK